ncbi:MAG: hypothetical protein H6978_03960 [Gammaproteobacteria bacterium]|nr:hypothetical protein [Gammaproteobacteria bacterium]
MKLDPLGVILSSLCAAIALATVCGTASAASADIPKLSGVWQFGSCNPDGSFNIRCMVLEEFDDLLTTRAQALRDVIDEATQPKYDCAPMPIPHMWTDPYSYKIEQLEDRVLIYYGKDDVVRTVWLEGHGHQKPKMNEFFYFGYSRGRYEDGALVIVTDKFTFDPEGLNADFRLPSSTQKQVTERMSIENGNLVLEVSTIDTYFLKAPWSFRVISRPDPNPWDGSWECDLAASRQILKLMAPAYPADPAFDYIEYSSEK